MPNVITGILEFLDSFNVRARIHLRRVKKSHEYGMSLARALYLKTPFSISTACKCFVKRQLCRKPCTLGLKLETLVGIIRLSTLGLNIDGSFLSYRLGQNCITVLSTARDGWQGKHPLIMPPQYAFSPPICAFFHVANTFGKIHTSYSLDQIYAKPCAGYRDEP